MSEIDKKSEGNVEKGVGSGDGDVQAAGTAG